MAIDTAQAKTQTTGEVVSKNVVDLVAKTKAVIDEANKYWAEEVVEAETLVSNSFTEYREALRDSKRAEAREALRSQAETDLQKLQERLDTVEGEREALIRSTLFPTFQDPKGYVPESDRLAAQERRYRILGLVSTLPAFDVATVDWLVAMGQKETAFVYGELMRRKEASPQSSPAKASFIAHLDGLKAANEPLRGMDALDRKLKFARETVRTYRQRAQLKAFAQNPENIYNGGR